MCGTTYQDGVECIDGNLAAKWTSEVGNENNGEETRRLTSECGLWGEIEASCCVNLLVIF
jgi:hypothetical protein